jgi:hypothetical protein
MPQMRQDRLAELSDTSAYEGHEDLVPAGIKAVYQGHGGAFYRVACEVSPRAVPLHPRLRMNLFTGSCVLSQCRKSR